MTLKNLKYVNDLGGISAQRVSDDGYQYLEPGSVLHDIAVSGVLGDIAPYVAPPKPEELPKYATPEGAIRAMAEFADQFVAPLIEHAPPAERLSWPVKEAAAEAHLAGEATPPQTDLLAAEASITGESLDELATHIVATAAIFRQVAAAIAGLRRKVAAEIRAEPDPHKFEPILLSAMADAESLALSLGIGEELGVYVNG
ncbi:MAG: hypothetical protein AAF982_01990 [Pseudomonadota bacterium]